MGIASSSFVGVLPVIGTEVANQLQREDSWEVGYNGHIDQSLLDQANRIAELEKKPSLAELDPFRGWESTTNARAFSKKSSDDGSRIQGLPGGDVYQSFWRS